MRNRDSSAIQRWATGWMIGGSIAGGGNWEFFSSSPRPHRFWGPPSLLSNGYHRLFPWGQGGRGVKLTIHLHLVPRSRMLRTVLPLPQYAFMAWCSVNKKYRDITINASVWNLESNRHQHHTEYSPLTIMHEGLWNHLNSQTCPCCSDVRFAQIDST
jgi:hypothetical protein